MDQQLHRLRGIFRAALFLGVTLYFTAVQILRALAGRRCPLRAAEYGQAWARLLIRILGVRLEVRGTPPKGPVLFVSYPTTVLTSISPRSSRARPACP